MNDSGEPGSALSEHVSRFSAQTVALSWCWTDRYPPWRFAIGSHVETPLACNHWSWNHQDNNWESACPTDSTADLLLPICYFRTWLAQKVTDLEDLVCQHDSPCCKPPEIGRKSVDSLEKFQERKSWPIWRSTMSNLSVRVETDRNDLDSTWGGWCNV